MKFQGSNGGKGDKGEPGLPGYDGYDGKGIKVNMIADKQICNMKTIHNVTM